VGEPDVSASKTASVRLCLAGRVEPIRHPHHHAREQVEGVVDQSPLPSCSELGLQCREVRAVVFDDDNFSINNGLPWNIEGAGNGKEAFRPVETVTRKRPLPPA
jgi:hypothetical protein